MYYVELHDDRSERIWNEAVLSKFKIFYYWLERLSKITKTLIHDSRSLNRYLNPEPSEEVWVQIMRPWDSLKSDCYPDNMTFMVISKHRTVWGSSDERVIKKSKKVDAKRRLRRRTERHFGFGGTRDIILFEGSQALPVRTSDKRKFGTLFFTIVL